jgi:hypothetical protein
MVDAVWVDRGTEYGLRRVADYGAGGSPMSLSRSGEWGAEKDPVRQAQSKIGEVAFALWLGLEPEQGVVNWEVEGKDGDGGFDVRVPGGYRVDVKTTLPPRKLIWSRQINDLYEGAKFDVLVAVSINGDDHRQCWIEGVISKGRFFRDKQISDGKNSGLAVGTWFIDKSELADIGQVLRGAVYRNSAGRFLHYCRCGEWGSFGYGSVGDSLGFWRCAKHLGESDAR